MSHGSPKLQIVSSYGFRLMEEFQIRKKLWFSAKVMLTLVWGPTGFAVVTAIDSGRKFNAGHSVNKVLIPVSEFWCECGGGTF
jgi:hypothetical protein